MSKIAALPKPAGPYQIGRAHLHFIDERRVDPFPPAGGCKRDVPFLIWYPSEEPGESGPSRLLRKQDLLALKRYFLYKIVPNSLCDILTNSFEDAPLACRPERFPVLIFNHGFSSYMEQNTILMEHLASFGYIVVSVGHPYDGVASYPDGRTLPVDFGSIKALEQDARRNSKAFSQNIKQLARDDLSLEERQQYTAGFLDASPAMNAKVETWIDDIRFVADTLQAMDDGSIPSQFVNKFDLAQGIGLFGQSYGGAAAILGCTLDERFHCGINLDGAMYGGLNPKYKYRQPAMYMDSDMFPGRSSYFFQINEHDAYHVTVRNSRHLDYSDLAYIRKGWLTRSLQLLGRVEGERMLRITNEYVRSFFDKYIKGLPAPLLESNPYPEVIYEWRAARASER